MSNVSTNRIEKLTQLVKMYDNKDDQFKQIVKLYKEMVFSTIAKSNNSCYSSYDLYNLIDEIRQIGAIIATVFLIFDLPAQAKHTSLSTTRVSQINYKECSKQNSDKICLDCWKLSFKYCELCLQRGMVHQCECKFNCILLT
jgi:hypothetical protein